LFLLYPHPQSHQAGCLPTQLRASPPSSPKYVSYQKAFPIFPPGPWATLLSPPHVFFFIIDILPFSSRKPPLSLSTRRFPPLKTNSPSPSLRFSASLFFASGSHASALFHFLHPPPSQSCAMLIEYRISVYRNFSLIASHRISCLHVPFLFRRRE
jgi:hypothetical protein